MTNSSKNETLTATTLEEAEVAVVRVVLVNVSVGTSHLIAIRMGKDNDSIGIRVVEEALEAVRVVLDNVSAGTGHLTEIRVVKEANAGVRVVLVNVPVGIGHSTGTIKDKDKDSIEIRERSKTEAHRIVGHNSVVEEVVERVATRAGVLRNMAMVEISRSRGTIKVNGSDSSGINPVAREMCRMEDFHCLAKEARSRSTEIKVEVDKGSHLTKIKIVKAIIGATNHVVRTNITKNRSKIWTRCSRRSPRS